MKLIYVTNSRLPTEKAHGVQISKMCEAFVKQGIEIELVCPKRKNKIKENFFEYYDIKKNFKLKKLWSLDLVGIVPHLGFRIQSLTFAISAFFYLKKYKGLIYSRDQFSSIILSFNKDIKIIFELHTLPEKIKFYHRFFLKRVYKFVVISQGLKKDLLKLGISESKILVASDGVDLEEFGKIKETKEDLRKKLNLPIDKKIISYIGRYKTMGMDKGVKMLIEVFAGILRKKKNIFLLLVGIDKNEINEVEKIFEKLRIKKENYKIILHIKKDKVSAYLKLSDILIMNYPNIKHYAYYMSPLKMFEYMASGVPIISSDLPSIKEILNKNNAIFFNADDSKNLAEKIKFILQNKELANKIFKQALKDVRSYTWEKRSEKIVKFIKSYN